MSQVSTEFIPTRIAILTVSNRRGEEDDTSGHYLRDSAQEVAITLSIKRLLKKTATPSARRYLRGSPATMCKWC